MHIPDGLVSGPINITSGVAAAGALALTSWRASREARTRPLIVPLLATTAAFVFAAQMLNFPVAGGTSGHFLGAAAVVALLGPSSACLVLSLVLIIQCLIFQDGGLSALGTNIVNMGIIGVLAAYVLMRAVRAFLPAGRVPFLVAVALGSWFSVLMASSACALEIAFSGTSPFKVVFPAMVGVHAIIGIGEALIPVAVVSTVLAVRPAILPDWARIDNALSVRPRAQAVWALALVGLAVALFLGLCVSPFASSSPDGLEKVAGDKGFLAAAEETTPLWQHSPMPDYAVPGVASERISTGLAGLIGTAGIFLVGFVVIRLLGVPAPREN